MDLIPMRNNPNQVHLDRDLNAALNLLHWITASSAGIHACGEAVRPGSQATLAEAGTEPHSTSCRFVYGERSHVVWSMGRISLDTAPRG
jgi:hypothetical protein